MIDRLGHYLLRAWRRWRGADFEILQAIVRTDRRGNAETVIRRRSRANMRRGVAGLTMPDEPQFTRRTVLAACDLLANHPAMDTHATFDGLIMRLGAEGRIPTGKRKGLHLGNKASALKRCLVANPSAHTPDGEFMADAVVREAARLPFSNQDECFTRALARDGFVVTNEGELRRMLPDMADLPPAQDEVHSLLEELNMATARGHLDQALDNHARGQWAAANSQLRSFIQDLFDE